jgi:hypothetical protein
MTPTGGIYDVFAVALIFYLALHLIGDCMAIYIWSLNRKINKLREEGAQAFIDHCKKTSSIDPTVLIEINIPGWRMTWPIKEAIKYGWVPERIRGDQKQ